MGRGPVVLSQVSLTRALFRAQQTSLWPIIPPAATTLVLLLGLAAGDALKVSLTVIPIAIVVFATFVPWLDARRRARGLVHVEATEGPGRALVELLKLPARVEQSASATYMIAVSFVVGASALLFRATPGRVGVAFAMLAPAALLGALRNRIALEQHLANDVLSLARITSDDWSLERRWRTSLALRLPWLALLSSASVVAGGAAALLPLITGDAPARSWTVLAFPVATATWFGLVGAHTFWALGRRYATASSALATAGAELLQGRGSGIAWVAADDTGDLARSLGQSLSLAMRRTERIEKASARLVAAAQELAGFSERQQDILTEQATTLAQTRLAAADVRKGSTVVAGRSRALLDGIQVADALAARGESRLVHALEALDRVRLDVDGISSRIANAGTRASRISEIALEVKELATRSNILALNAAIEATRAGESARGFGVVAAEMRRLADESVKATRTAAESLSDVRESIDRASSASREGVGRITHGLETVRLSGDAIGELAGLVRTQTSALSEIAAAVTQQASGVEQLFGAIHQLSSAMDATVRELDVNRTAAENVRRIAAELVAVEEAA